MKNNIKDPRSTGRKRARRTLFNTKRLYACQICGITSRLRPPEAPNNFEEFWPLESGLSEATLLKTTTKSALQANHINKNVLDNDPANLEWLCPPCHKKKDLTTSVGESVIENEFGY